MTDTAQQGIDFGSQIADSAFQQDLDYSAIFTGLSVAASAFIVDYAAAEDGSVDEMSLLYTQNKFFDGVRQAVEFAVASLNKPAV